MMLLAPPAARTMVEEGFAFLRAGETRAWLARSGQLADWADFSASWENMGQDTYMKDGGRYRRRRFAIFAAPADPSGKITRRAHGPHYQALDYNSLNGGVARWFEPMPESVGDSQTLTTILAATRELFGALKPGAAWHIELHQFRIEARTGEAGQPTPEGMHRDGVDYVLVLMIQRRNIASGATTIHDLSHAALGSFTLAEPLDAALVDDRRVFHGVTPVEPIDPAAPAFRDVLVVTFRAAESDGSA